MNDNAKKWVKALRSGDYEQGQGKLAQYQEDTDDAGASKVQYCCLGVACDLYLKENNDLLVDRSYGFVHFDNYAHYLPEKVRQWLGVESSEGHYGALVGLIRPSSLAGDNDAGQTFKQIADTIEQEPEGLFV